MSADLAAVLSELEAAYMVELSARSLGFDHDDESERVQVLLLRAVRLGASGGEVAAVLERAGRALRRSAG